MTTVPNNKFLLFILFVFLLCSGKVSGVNEPYFEVRGDSSLLNKVIINVRVYSNNKNNVLLMNHNDETLLYLGKVFMPDFNRYHDKVYYLIMYTYDNKMNALGFDATIPRLTMEKRTSQVITVLQQGSGVYITYHNEGVHKMKGNMIISGSVTLPPEDYFNKHNQSQFERQLSLDDFRRLSR